MSHMHEIHSSSVDTSNSERRISDTEELMKQWSQASCQESLAEAIVASMVPAEVDW